MEKEQAVLDQQNKLIEDYLSNYQVLDEYMYPQLSSYYFTYKKHQDPKNKGKYLDNEVCEVCGKNHQYVLVVDKTPVMCYKCYQTVRAYKSLLFDTLRLKKKKDLTVKDCKKIVQYMKTFSKVKLLALAALSASLTSSLTNK